MAVDREVVRVDIIEHIRSTEDQRRSAYRGKEKDKQVIEQREKRRGKKDFTLAQRIYQDKYPGEDVTPLLDNYKDKFQKTDNLVTEDIFSPRAFKLDLVKPALISEPYLARYFKTVVGSFTDFNRAGVEDAYIREPEKWLKSATNRGRMVAIEATDDNLKEIADAIVNASPLERVVALGLDADKQTALKQELIASWETKIESQGESEAYKGRILHALRTETNNDTAVLLEDFELQSLMGPHALTTDLDISYKSLQTQLDSTFGSKIDEIILYGNTNSLAQALPDLTKSVDAGRYLAIKAGEFGEDSVSQWTARLTNTAKPIEHLTSSKDPKDILSEDTIGMNADFTGRGLLGSVKHALWPGFDVEVVQPTEKNYELNPKFEKIVTDLGAHYKLAPKEVDYLKNLFISNSLYPPNLSPGLYSSTITKTQSGINGEGAVVVGNALREGNIGRQVATAKGVLFAVNATMFDTANDINLEAQERTIIYKTLLQDMLSHYGENPEMDNDQAFEQAMDDLFHAYTRIEKEPTITMNEVQGEVDRVYTIENANEANNRNRLGINLLLPSPVGVLYGAGATVAGITLATTGASSSIAFPITGVASFATFTGILATSLELQRTANADNLARWHRASARAHGSMRSALDQIKKLGENFAENAKNPGPDHDRDLGPSQAVSVNISQEEKTEISAIREPEPSTQTMAAGGDTFSEEPYQDIELGNLPTRLRRSESVTDLTALMGTSREAVVPTSPARSARREPMAPTSPSIPASAKKRTNPNNARVNI